MPRLQRSSTAKALYPLAASRSAVRASSVCVSSGISGQLKSTGLVRTRIDGGTVATPLEELLKLSGLRDRPYSNGCARGVWLANSWRRACPGKSVCRKNGSLSCQDRFDVLNDRRRRHHDEVGSPMIVVHLSRGS